MIPTKAVLPVGGWGTRFLPATKSIPKAMFPIMNKPIVHYVVDEAISGGIEQIIFVVSPNSRLIEDYFSPNPGLDRALEQTNKTGVASELNKLCHLAHFSSTPAKPRGVYQGLGVGVLNARPLVGQEPFAVLLPNDMLDTEIPCMRSLTAVFDTLQCPVIAVHRVPIERLSTYGNVGVKALDRATSAKLAGGLCNCERVWEVTKLIQKPNPEKQEHVSDYAVIGRFVLLPDVFTILESIPPGYEGEVQLIDALEKQRQGGQRIYAYEFEGQYFDTRSEAGYVEAMVNEACKRPGTRELVRSMLLSRIARI